ncbi:MAG: DUF1178 family protein [Geminicoccales bacterium]
MILFDLRCSRGHEFEAWFRDGAAYEKQAEAGAISCVMCGDSAVSKAPMAPAVSSARKADRAATANAMRLWRQVQGRIERDFDHVGRRFPEEARKMHHGEIERRSIYGEATSDEARALRDEGIEVSQIPWLPREDA